MIHIQKERSEQAVQDFVKALEAQPQLTNVTPKKRDPTSRRGLHKWDFSIHADVVPGGGR